MMLRERACLRPEHLCSSICRYELNILKTGI
jgi:hypothetical protein